MGTAVAHPGGSARLEVDLDREAWRGRRLLLQVLRPGDRLPTLAATLEVDLAGPEGPVAALELDLDPADGSWLVVRVTDPAEPADPRATGDWARQGRAIAYTSPFWLEPRP
jgi:hypothetical protein